MSGGNWKEMLIATENGDIELVKYHLRMGIDPNYQHPEFLTTPLVEALKNGHLDVAKTLLENGANPLIKEIMSKKSPMSIAQEQKNLTAIRLLNSYLPSQKIVVTGGNRGIGKAIVQQLLAEGHQVVMTVRDKIKGDLVAQELIKATENANISVIQGDLSNIKSCYQLCLQLKQKHPDINVLINNAGIWMTEKELNEDGLEKSFMVNYLAPYILSHELLPILEKNNPARIVNVNAGLYIKGKLDIEKTPQGLDFHSFKTYATTKLCGIMFTIDFAEKIAATGVSINAVHPGVINTGLGDSPKLLSKLVKLVKRFWKSPDYGAQAPVWLAVSDEVAVANGLYYDEKKVMPYIEVVKNATFRRELRLKTELLLNKGRLGN